jgi:hypothetical protein
MIKAACHCGAVRLEADPAPTWVNDCNCSICRRYGALWAYYQPGQAQLVSGQDQIEIYGWGRRGLVFHRCRECGCVTHWTPADNLSVIAGVNARMMPSLDPQTVTVRRSNHGGGSWFWSRPDEPIRSGHDSRSEEGPEPHEWR